VPGIYTADRIKTDNPQLYYVIDKLIEAVQKNGRSVFSIRNMMLKKIRFFTMMVRSRK
jgi:hypothetical protein